MKRKLLMAFAFAALSTTALAQRHTDQLGRGLVAAPSGSGNVVTWRRQADENEEVTYNLYRNGVSVRSNTSVSCYEDKSGTASSTYQVAAVINGVEQEKCDAVTPWSSHSYRFYNSTYYSAYLDINLAKVYDRDGKDVTANYEPNDAEMADLDGDGELEIIIKRLNTKDGGSIYPVDSREFVVLDAYKVNWTTGEANLMWRIDCGPNMVSMNSTELNIIAFDWDEDGKAEVVLRGADNMIIYGSDGITPLWTVGNMNLNTRDKISNHSDAQYAWTITGAEYLIYMNGKTGEKYQVTEYPLRRLESGETSLNAAWGDGYGHRSTKHFLGAPFFDGRHASLFLARGIYTRHKMIAMDLDPATHQWEERWRWNCNTKGPWYGQGNHNYVVADVDEDGRDEIVYGSMTIDDNGHGLSTTGLGHGDALHVGDLDPYRKGLEVFACNEDQPSNNLRNATTSEIYYRQAGGGDDGRCLMDNLSDNYPGSLGRSVNAPIVSAVTGKTIDDALGIDYSDLNFRIYWDGDLCSEILNSPGEARDAKIDKYGGDRIFLSEGCNMNNSSKNNPCFQGDIIGDWREELVLRHGGNLRVYTTSFPTTYSLPCLWYDHQYRQAMVWQMMAYNQPPHTSYFVGKMEGYTQAPPPLTNTGREEVADGGMIDASLNGQHVMLCETNDMTVSVADGATPFRLTVNTPTWVQGHDDNDNITMETYTHTLTGGALKGSMRLAKQGDGVLVLPNAEHTYTGDTHVWGGTLQCDGHLTNSELTMDRFTTLVSNGGTFDKKVTMNYGATLQPGTDEQAGTVKIYRLTMNPGSRLVIDLFSNQKYDQLEITRMDINGTNWENGPEFQQPVLQFVSHTGEVPQLGTYKLGTIGSIGKGSGVSVGGTVDFLKVEGLDWVDYELKYDKTTKELTLVIGGAEAVDCPIPEITQTGTTGDGLPVVDISVQPFSLPTEEVVTPSLSATFTNMTDNESEVDIITMGAIYTEDYESATQVTGWSNIGIPMSIDKDSKHGNYLYFNTGSTNTRRAHTYLSGVDVSTCARYMVEFDLAVKSGTKDGVEFCVMTKGGAIPSDTWGSYLATNNNQNILFSLAAGANSTTFNLNGTSTTATLGAGTWYHYTLDVDRAYGLVKWTITNLTTGKNVKTGTYSLANNASYDVDGFFVLAGRTASLFKLDNIKVLTEGFFGYTFTEPGTLRVTASYAHCNSSEATFEYVGEVELIPGDVSGDKDVNIVDVTSTISYILGQVPDNFSVAAADVNNDNKIDIVDVTTIIDMILNK